MKNPILQGFHPDPSICRKDDDFFIATSSFQWWPGVPVYHSKDLKNWELYSYALTDHEVLNMHRIQDSAGIWAPCLSYSDGLFWLIFTVANGSRLNLYECSNYLTTAEDPKGPWSKPVYLNSSGNDPSLFHDEDGRKWLVNTHFSPTPSKFGHKGTLLQEYSVKERKLVGPVRNIFPGTSQVAPEGSKLHKHRGWYYLLIAEGGTQYGHQATMARSRNIWGPFEVHPENPILTAKYDQNNPVQRAGHADIVHVNGDEVAVVYLASRPVNRHSLLGRETFLAKAKWCEDDWLRLEERSPALELPDFGFTEHPFLAAPERDDFDGDKLSLDWNSLRLPMGERIDLQTRPSWLCLQATPSCIDSLVQPSIIAKRIRHHIFHADTYMEFMPSEPDQWAGLICYYDSRHWYFLARIFEPDEGDGVMLMCKRKAANPIERLDFIPLGEEKGIRLGVECDGIHFRFKFAVSGQEDWHGIGNPESCQVISDEYVESKNDPDPIPAFGFTGGMIGFAAFDITERAERACFDWFEYKGNESWPHL